MARSDPSLLGQRAPSSLAPCRSPTLIPCPTDTITAFTSSRNWANYHCSVKKLFLIKSQHFFIKPSSLRRCLCSGVSWSPSTEGRALVTLLLCSPACSGTSPLIAPLLLYKVLPGTISSRLSPAPALSSSFLQLLRLGWWHLPGTQRSWYILCLSCCMASAVI